MNNNRIFKIEQQSGSKYSKGTFHMNAKNANYFLAYIFSTTINFVDSFCQTETESSVFVCVCVIVKRFSSGCCIPHHGDVRNENPHMNALKL